MPSNQFNRTGPPQTYRETNALMARVQSVSQKADALLSNAGRTNSNLRGAGGAAQGAAYPTERLVDLTERLARLETLLDEVASLGSLRPATARADSEATRALSFRSQGSHGGGGSDVGIILNVAPPLPVVPLVGAPPQVIGPTPRSSARFIEVSSGMPGATPPVPGFHPPGTYSPAMPTPSFLNRQILQGPNNAPWNPASSPPPVGFWNAAETTPRAGSTTPFAGGMGTPRVGSRALRASVAGYGSMGGRAEMDMQRLQQVVGPSEPMHPMRSFSAPRQGSVPPIAVVTSSPLQQMGPPIIGTGVSTPGMPPPPGLWMPSLGQLLQDNVDAKIRRWLKTIPIGNGADRGWDDAQIAEIASFAQDHHLEHLAAEDIYKKYVEHQVESAGAN